MVTTVSMEWTILGATVGIKGYCDVCRTEFLIERPSLGTRIVHCGQRQTLPERIYEKWCDAKEAWNANRKFLANGSSSRDGFLTADDFKVRSV